MRIFFKVVFIIELFLLPFLFMHMPSATASGGEVVMHPTENKYKIRILLAQWEIKAYDEVKAEEEGINVNAQFDNDALKDWKHLEMKHRVEGFEKGSTVVFNVYSKDVQHGFSINELDLAVAAIRPTGDQEIGDGTNTGDLQWPDDDVTISSFCHIFCGLGHPDMKMKFVIGEGSPEIGLWIFYGVIAINIAIFGFVAYSIAKKITV